MKLLNKASDIIRDSQQKDTAPPPWTASLHSGCEYFKMMGDSTLLACNDTRSESILVMLRWMRLTVTGPSHLLGGSNLRRN